MRLTSTFIRYDEASASFYQQVADYLLAQGKPVPDGKYYRANSATRGRIALMAEPLRRLMATVDELPFDPDPTPAVKPTRSRKKSQA